MATGQRCGQRVAVTVDDQLVLRTGAAAVDELTALEAQVARLARDGLSNGEIGAG